MKPCTQGPRHKWTWLKNSTSGQISGRGVSLSLRGIYRCACGEHKAGDRRQRLQFPAEQTKPLAVATLLPLGQLELFS